MKFCPFSELNIKNASFQLFNVLEYSKFPMTSKLILSKIMRCLQKIESLVSEYQNNSEIYDNLAKSSF